MSISDLWKSATDVYRLLTAHTVSAIQPILLPRFILLVSGKGLAFVDSSYVGCNADTASKRKVTMIKIAFPEAENPTNCHLWRC